MCEIICGGGSADFNCNNIHSRQTYFEITWDCYSVSKEIVLRLQCEAYHLKYNFYHKTWFCQNVDHTETFEMITGPFTYFHKSHYMAGNVLVLVLSAGF